MVGTVQRSLLFLTLGTALLLIFLLLTEPAGAANDANVTSPTGTVEIEDPGALLTLDLHGAILLNVPD
jgi:hypothetical protein